MDKKMIRLVNDMIDVATIANVYVSEEKHIGFQNEFYKAARKELWDHNILHYDGYDNMSSFSSALAFDHVDKDDLDRLENDLKKKLPEEYKRYRRLYYKAPGYHVHFKCTDREGEVVVFVAKADLPNGYTEAKILDAVTSAMVKASQAQGPMAIETVSFK